MSLPARESLPRLFFSFLRLGLAAFGGPAMVAYIRKLAVGKKQWITEDSFRNGVGIAQSIPGATAMQVAAYVGLRAAGPLGAVVTFCGFGLPAFVLMAVLAAVYSKTQDMDAVVSAFKGLQVIVVALVLNATISFGRNSIKKWQDVVLGIGATALLLYKVSPVLTILLSAFLGTILYKNMEMKGAIKENSEHASFWQNLTVPIMLVLLLATGLIVLFFLDRKLFDLGTLMLKVDLFAFGGGYASVPLMLHEVVDVRHWMDSKIFMDGIALGQVTPGPMVITATFVGFFIGGIPGAMVGTVAVFTPSLIILTSVVPYFDRLRGNAIFQRALRGALVSFVGLLLAVSIQFTLAVHWGYLNLLIAIAAFVALRLKVDILWVVLVGAGISALIL